MEIFLRDLKKEKQKEILDFMKIDKEEEGNLDVIPLFVIPEENEERDKDGNLIGYSY